MGCGDGLFFPRLAELGHVRGIEVDEGLISPDNPYQSSISTAPLQETPFESGSFDLITGLDVIEHIEDLQLIGFQAESEKCSNWWPKDTPTGPLPE